MNTDSIFSPITINSLAIKNRLVMSSMVTQYAAGNGEVTDQMLNYYADRARGGVGLIMVEATYVERQGNSYRLGLGIDSDAMLPGLTRLTRAVHACGGKIGIQLQHGGRTANPQTNGGPVKLVSYIPGITPYEGARLPTFMPGPPCARGKPGSTSSSCTARTDIFSTSFFPPSPTADRTNTAAVRKTACVFRWKC